MKKKIKTFNPKRAKKHLDAIYRLSSQIKSPFKDLSDEEIIKKLRKTREKLWEEKLAPHS
ncbi:MAG: hypothetical protein V1872_01195 [bacterium]